MRTLGLIRRGTPPPHRDLWATLQSRMQQRDELVRVPIPAIGWRELAAAAAAIAMVAVVPDPFGFLAASGML